MTDWTEPDRSEERWLPSPEWGAFDMVEWPEEWAGPEYWFAKDCVWIHEMTIYPDGYAPRARFVSDRP